MKPAWLLGAAALAAVVLVRRRRLEPPVVVVGLAVAAGMGVYGTGIIELPNLAEVLEGIGRTLGPWTYLLVGALSFLEAAAFVGMLVPGETTVVVGGVVAGQGQIDIVALIAIAWSSAFLGDLTGYFLGKRLGRPFILRYGPRFGIDRSRIERVEEFFASHGGKAIFIGRFIGVVRSLAPFLAGSSRMPLRRFIPYDILGSGLQSTMLCLLGYFFWHSLDRVLDFVQGGALALGATVVVIVGLVITVRWLRVPGNRAWLRAWLEARREHRPARWALDGYDRAQAPLRFLIERITPGGYGLELTTLLAAASVAGYVFLGYLLALSPGELTLGDRRGREWAEAIQLSELDSVASLFTLLGGLPAVGAAAAVTGIALIARRHVLEGLALWWGLALAAIGIWLTKGAIWVPDPAAWPVDGPLPRGPAPSGGGEATYPSAVGAYAVTWVAIALALRHAVERLAQVAGILAGSVALAVAIALSTVYLGRDWFSDAAGGLGLGVLAFSTAGVIAFAVSALADRTARRDG